MKTDMLDAETYLKKFDLSHLFFKFIDAQYADDFIKKGILHFEPFVNFNKMTDGESGDQNEGSVALFVEKAILTLAVPRHPEPMLVEDYMLEEGFLQYSNENLKHFGLTCMFYVHQLSGLEVEPITPENYAEENTEHFEKIAKINENVLNKFSSFLKSENNKDKVAFLIFPQKLIDRMIQKGYILPRGPVTYYDKKDKDFFDEAQNGDILKTLFVKTNDYSHQQEYRFVLPEKLPAEGKNIVLGNLEDIVIRLDFDQIYNLRAFFKDEKS